MWVDKWCITHSWNMKSLYLNYLIVKCQPILFMNSSTFSLMICELSMTCKILSFSVFVTQVAEQFSFPQERQISTFVRRILLLIVRESKQIIKRSKKMQGKLAMPWVSLRQFIQDFDFLVVYLFLIFAWDGQQRGENRK